VSAFFELLGSQRYADIQTVAMNINTAYDLEVRRHCPNAETFSSSSREIMGRHKVRSCPCTLQLEPIMIGSLSPRSTATNHTLAR
jgi:hypothetical protein